MQSFRRILILLIFGTVFIGIGFRSIPYAHNFLLDHGFLEEEILIAGTGSMYPTFPKGEGSTDEIRAKQTVALPKMRRYPTGLKLFGKTYFSTTLERGDIIQFENDIVRKISKEKYGEETGFVKRVIGLPGDTIELRDGFVILNGNTLSEPYIAKPRSSYGGDYLDDCMPLTIPKGKVFVMGDNRKASLDSRFSLGLVDIVDIHHILPWKEQTPFKKYWRDTSKDTDLANTSTLDINLFIQMLNEKRKTDKKTPLKSDELLAKSSKIRGAAMIVGNDFSTEATKSGVTLEKSIEASGYQNITFAELFTKGFYEADELLENFLEFPDTKKILYSSDYQDIGVASPNGFIAECPVQAIVTHLGGYVPPTYKTEDINNWERLVANLENVYPSWKQLQNNSDIDKEKLNQLLYLFEKRISNAKQILVRMQSKQWLTAQEKGFAKDDATLQSTMEQLISQLNTHQ